MFGASPARTTGTSMLGWIFKKRANEPGSAPAVVTTSTGPPPVAGASVPDMDWTAALAQARGDDDALLALARTAAAPLQVKQAAVEALDGETALKLAEREFRGHDRRVHHIAKQRLLAKAAQRQTRDQGARLLATARSLAGMVEVPVNRLVELERAWQLLNAGAIESAQRDDFVALTAQLAAQLRQRVDIELQRQRWQADAVATLRQLQAACTEAAAGTQERQRLAGATGAARGVEDALPPGDVAVQPPPVRWPTCSMRSGSRQRSMATWPCSIVCWPVRSRSRSRLPTNQLPTLMRVTLRSPKPPLSLATKPTRTAPSRPQPSTTRNGSGRHLRHYPTRVWRRCCRLAMRAGIWPAIKRARPGKRNGANRRASGSARARANRSWPWPTAWRMPRRHSTPGSWPTRTAT